MGESLLPIASAASAVGVAGAMTLGSDVPPWMYLALGVASLAFSVAVGPPTAGRPGVLASARVLGGFGDVVEGGMEPASVTAVAPQRLVAGPRRSRTALVLAVAGIALVTGGWGRVHADRVEASLVRRIAPGHVSARGSVREDPAPGTYGWTAVVDLSFEAWDGGRAAVDETVLAEGDGPVPRVVRGDRVWFEGRVDVPDSSEFASSLSRRGIAAVVQADAFERDGPASNPVVRAAQSFRDFASRAIGRLYRPREAGLLMGLALGDDSNIDAGVERDFRATGLSHLLVVSGENVAMVLAPILAVSTLLRLPVAGRMGVGIATVGFFVLLTGAEPSVLRAGVMASIGLVGIGTGRPRSSAAMLGGAVLVLLLADPTLVWSTGFQLSVAATAGMLALAEPISRRLRILPRPISLAMGTTLAAQLGVLPLLLHDFGEVPGVAIGANVAAFPAVAPAMLLGLASAAAGIVWLPAGRVLAIAASAPMRYLEILADRLARAPVPWITSGGGPWALAIGSALVAAIVWRLRSGRRLPRHVVAAAALLMPVFVWATALSAGAPSGLRITFFDVGQGDAALVTSPSGAAILVDGGPDPDQVAAKLSALGVRRLDVVVASHPHADHIIGLPAVLARFRVGVAMDPGCPDASSIYEDLRTAIRDDGVRVVHPRAGDSFEVGDLRLDVLSPAACFVGTPSDANNDAIVFRLTWREDTVLFATEPEEPAQQTMLDSGASLQAEVLKVPHHGAATSLPEFFDAVGARIAIVSVGPNPYGHPVPAVLDEIRSSGAQVLRTDRLGDITLDFASDGLHVESTAS
jgi:competence protein ComEC